MSCHFLVLLSLTNATSLYRSKQKLSFVASHFLLQLVMLFHPDQYDYLDCRLVWLMGWTKAPFLLSEGLTHILPISPGPQIYIALYIDCLSPLGLLQSLTTMVAIKSNHEYDAHQEVCSSWVARWAEKKRTGGEILHSVICQMLLLPSTKYWWKWVTSWMSIDKTFLDTNHNLLNGLQLSLCLKWLGVHSKIAICQYIILSNKSSYVNILSYPIYYHMSIYYPIQYIIICQYIILSNILSYCQYIILSNILSYANILSYPRWNLVGWLFIPGASLPSSSSTGWLSAYRWQHLHCHDLHCDHHHCHQRSHRSHRDHWPWYHDQASPGRATSSKAAWEQTWLEAHYSDRWICQR